MSCCDCKLFDEECLKKAASIPIATQWVTLEEAYIYTVYDLEEKLGRHCVELLCENKEDYTEVLNELLPWFGANMNMNYKQSKISNNYVMGSAQVPELEDKGVYASIKQLRFRSEQLWNRFQNWACENKDLMPAECKCCGNLNGVEDVSVLSKHKRVRQSPFYRGRNPYVR